ncbi:MAG: hypothetical protein U0670_11550 [Anaerolineae bacterium]
MQPGLSRAIPMAVLGFLFGSLLVIVLRFLQSLDPIWAVGPGLVASVIFTAIFFVWGMGAFDPKMSQHGEEAEAHHEEAEVTTAEPRQLIGSAVWTLSTWVLVVVGLVWAFALIPGGFALKTTVVPEASLTEVGFFTMSLFGRDIQVSELVVFMAFFIFMMGSLAVIGGAIGWLFTTISRGLVEGRAAAGAGAPLLTGAVSSPAPSTSPISIPPSLRMVITAVVTFVVVYGLFYAVLLPWTISHAPDYITPFAVIFALLAAVFVARPPFVSRTLQIWALILFLFGILYFVFYEVAIGMVLNERFDNLYIFGFANQRILASLANALLFAVLIVRPSWIVWLVGRVARIALIVLRALPRVLFQR